MSVCVQYIIKVLDQDLLAMKGYDFILQPGCRPGLNKTPGTSYTNQQRSITLDVKSRLGKIIYLFICFHMRYAYVLNQK